MADISNNDVGSANSQFPAFGRFVDCADHCALDLKLAPRRSQVTFSAPKFSRRNPDPRHELAQIPPEIARPYALRPPTVRHYLPEATIEQKIIALATRAETQARDVFDLDLLFRNFK